MHTGNVSFMNNSSVSITILKVCKNIIVHRRQAYNTFVSNVGVLFKVRTLVFLTEQKSVSISSSGLAVVQSCVSIQFRATGNQLFGNILVSVGSSDRSNNPANDSVSPVDVVLLSWLLTSMVITVLWNLSFPQDTCSKIKQYVNLCAL